MAAFLEFDPKLKRDFFDRKRVVDAIERKSLDALWWFGGRMREKTRQKIGKPVLYGSVVRTNSGKLRRVGNRKPRPPGKPPKARTGGEQVTLRKVQYRAKLGGPRGAFGGVQAFIPKFPGTPRDRGKTVPELHEFGGVVKRRAKVETKVYKTGKRAGKPKRDASGKRQKRLIISGDLPFRSFRIRRRPYLAPTFERASKEFGRRLKQGRFE